MLSALSLGEEHGNTHGGAPPIVFAACHGHDVAVQVLHDGRAQLYAAATSGATAFCAASAEGHVLVVRLLCELRADMNRRIENRYGPLECAYKSAHINVGGIDGKACGQWSLRWAHRGPHAFV